MKYLRSSLDYHLTNVPGVMFMPSCCFGTACHRSRARCISATITFLFVVILLVVFRAPVSAQELAPAPSPTSTPSTAAPGLTAYEERYLAQQDRIWWVTIAALFTTAAVTMVGWIVTYQQQARLVRRQEESAAQLQARLLRLQEQLERERALKTTRLEKLRSLSDYIEFPNHHALKVDRDELLRLYNDQWEDRFAYFSQLALRFDDGASGDPLATLLTEMDRLIDGWAHALKGGVHCAEANQQYLLPAMKVSLAALDRLDEIEERLVLGRIEQGQ